MYLTDEEYIDRASQDETERLANENEVLDGTIDQTETYIVNMCIKDASELVDSYLRGRYQLPLSTIPELIKRLTFQVARYYLYEKKGLTEDVLQTFDRAINELRRIAKGESRLDAPELSAEQSSGQIKYVKGTPLFSRENMAGY